MIWGFFRFFYNNGGEKVTFDDIMKYNEPYNLLNFERLVSEIKSNNIVPYIGAGMSMLSDDVYPSWNEFLNGTYEKFKISLSKDIFSSLSYEDKAGYLIDNIGKITFANHLRNVFEVEHLDVSNYYFTDKAVYYLPMIFEKGLIVTTNYDKVIEKIYSLFSKTLSVSHPGHFEALNGALKNKSLLLFKIHGDYCEPNDSIILTTEQYDLAYSNEILVNSLKQIFISKSILFLGCSIMKDRPIELLRKDSVNGMSNFAFISCNSESLNERRKQLENEYYTQAIIYPEHNHECVKILLGKIAESINSIVFNSRMTKQISSDSVNRFKYNAETCDFSGRENEINQLHNFCNSEKLFLWWCISGVGGVGKSRLVWEFGKILKHYNNDNVQNWNIVWDIPDGRLTMDTLIVIDDALSKSESIAKFIEKENHQDLSYKCRLLIINRDFNQIYESINDKMETPCLIDELSYIKYSLDIKPLNEINLKNIARSYAKNRGSCLSDKQLNEVIMALVKIDKKLNRPLYLLFIADALIDKDDVSNWDRRDALEYIYNKEIFLLNKRIRDILRRKNPIFERTFNAVFLLINFIEPIELHLVSKVIEKYINLLNSYLVSVGYTCEDFFRELDLIDNNRLIYNVPNIVKEFIVLKLMEELDKQVIVDVFSAVWCNIDLSWKCIENLYDDFEDILYENNLNEYFENVKISSDCKRLNVTAFWAHRHLKSVFIPSTVEVISYGSFNYCENLTNINVDNKNKKYASINGILFNKNKSELIEYPYGRKEAILNVQNKVISLKIHDNDTLKKIILSSSIKKIAILNCKNLESIVLNEGLEEISHFFNGCNSLKKIIIPKSVKFIEENIVNSCENLEKIDVDVSNENYFSHDGVLYSKKDRSLVLYPLGKKDQEYSVKEETLSIESKAFLNNKYICKIVIPDGVKSIGGMAFAYCMSLQIVCMANTVEFIDRFVFAGCYNLRSVNLSLRLKVIEDQLFVDCKNIKSIYIPSNVSRIGYEAFAGCSKLKNIEISNGVEVIDKGCFRNCYSLERIALPLNLRRIRSGTFSKCTSLRDIILPNNVTEMDREAFYQTYPKIHIRKDNQYFIKMLNSFFSDFKDDLFTVNYYTSEKNDLLNKKNEIEGCKITKLDIICNDNQYEFEYWYKDKDCTEKWDYDFDVMPDHDICLYVKIIKTLEV